MLWATQLQTTNGGPLGPLPLGKKGDSHCVSPIVNAIHQAAQWWQEGSQTVDSLRACPQWTGDTCNLPLTVSTGPQQVVGIDRLQAGFWIRADDHLAGCGAHWCNGSSNFWFHGVLNTDTLFSGKDTTPIQAAEQYKHCTGNLRGLGSRAASTNLLSFGATRQARTIKGSWFLGLLFASH